MRKCPICDEEADSLHHIKPRKLGGTDDSRNLLWLCRECHDEYEGLELSPDKLQELRRQKKGARAVSSEEYWYLWREDGILFIGIKVPNRDVVHYDVLFPYGAQIEMSLHGTEKDESAVPQFEMSRSTRGRKPNKIPAYLLPTLEDDTLSLRQKAELLGVSKSTVARKIREMRAAYVV